MALGLSDKGALNVVYWKALGLVQPAVPDTFIGIDFLFHCIKE